MSYSLLAEKMPTLLERISSLPPSTGPKIGPFSFIAVEDWPEGVIVILGKDVDHSGVILYDPEKGKR